MKLLIKINLSLAVAFGLGLVGVARLTDDVLQENARREVISHAGLMMEAAMAARSYTNEEIKPLLSDKLKTVFLPQSVPSYAATHSFKTLHARYADYSYKEATLNPTNPRNRVVEWEADVVQNLRDHPEIKEFVGERSTPTGPSLYLARPIRINDNHCLQCHSTPAAAPETMKALYGTNNGFGWKLGEIVGSQIVSLPTSVPMEKASRAFKQIMGGMIATFVGLLLVVNAILYMAVLRPMNRMARIADAISEGKSDVEEFNVARRDEFGVLGTAFNRMRRSLEKAMALLD
jgi:protein-histidine pros-kinase